MVVVVVVVVVVAEAVAVAVAVGVVVVVVLSLCLLPGVLVFQFLRAVDDVEVTVTVLRVVTWMVMTGIRYSRMGLMVVMMMMMRLWTMTMVLMAGLNLTP